MEIKTIGVGEIPVDQYLQCLSESRDFNKHKAFSYAKEIYGIDISKEIVKVFWWNEKDAFITFEENNPRKRQDDGTRQYFQSYGRNYYLRFINNSNQDKIAFWIKGDIVHHIHPLIFDGDNSLENLILLSDLSHNLLHLNPLENIRKCNFMALDYLSYLYSRFDNLVEKYQLKNYENNPRLWLSIAEKCLEEEMLQFYDKLKNNHNVLIGENL